MTLTELSKRVDVSIVNLSVLKNDRAKTIRFPHSQPFAPYWSVKWVIYW